MLRLALIAMLVLAPVLAARAGQAAPAARHEIPPAPRVSVSPLDAGLDKLEEHFLKPIPRLELEARALAALLRELDPYSRYLDPDALALHLADISGKFVGIGVNMAFDEASGYPVVGYLLHGGVAGSAGIRRGDLLVAVDGASLRGLDYERVSAALRGTVGSKVRVRVQRAGVAEPIDFELQRVAIASPSVRGLRRDASGRYVWWLDRARRLGYARISSLTRETARELEAVLTELKRGHARGLVLDLRDCAGGLMNGALESADLFIDRGRLLTIVHRGRDDVFDARRGKYTALPLVVLANAGTVSSGEILLGALKDSGRATVVGERSFGKGRIQVLFDLGGGRGGVMISSGSFQRPNGQTIDKHDLPAGSNEAPGIAPDVEVKMSADEHAAWLEFTEKTTGSMVLAPDEQTDAPPDPVLAKAIEILRR